MSKKKSRAWDRKTTGHIATGVLNYSRLERFAVTKRVPIRKKRKALAESRRESALQEHAQSTRNVNWELVQLMLRIHPTMSLTDAIATLA